VQESTGRENKKQQDAEESDSEATSKELLSDIEETVTQEVNRKKGKG